MDDLYTLCNISHVPPARFELATYSLGGSHSSPELRRRGKGTTTTSGRLSQGSYALSPLALLQCQDSNLVLVVNSHPCLPLNTTLE
jgi:hypothetical protein